MKEATHDDVREINRQNDKEYIHETWMNDWKYFVTDEILTSASVNGDFQGLKLPREVVDKIYREREAISRIPNDHRLSSGSDS